MITGSLKSHTVRSLARWNVTIDTHSHLATRPTSIGLQPLDAWHGISFTRTHIIAMITMVAGKPPLTRAEFPSNRLSPMQTRTFHTKVRHRAQGPLTLREGGQKSTPPGVGR
jgi:hypothetical protein